MKNKKVSGRGAQGNPTNRFAKHSYENSEDTEDQKTRFIMVNSKTIVNKVKSPDVGMDYSLNPYQGCEHGCTYCYARPTHEYWGYSSGVDFEQTILVKLNAADLLRECLEKKSWKVSPIILSGNTDCYQPAEKKFKITRKLLEVFLDYKHPVGIITKNALILRDLDVIIELAKENLIAVNVSITTMDEELRRNLEPRTSTIKKRFELVRKLSEYNIPVNVMLAPVIPALNDQDIFAIAKASSEAGAQSFSSHLVRLMGPNEELFENWLETYYPDRRDKVMNQLRELHQGKTGSSEFGVRGRGVGPLAENIRNQRKLAQLKYFSASSKIVLNTFAFKRPSDNQLHLF